VNLLEDLHARRVLCPVPSYYPGIRVERGQGLETRISQLKELGAEFTDASHGKWKDGLTFRTLHSLDLEIDPLLSVAR
jgi:hypothetical protein